jgi:hypothetical protein
MSGAETPDDGEHDPWRWMCEVAIYRLSEDAWADETRSRVERRVEASLRNLGDSEDDRRRATIWAEQIERPYPWEYNQIVGWVRLLWDGPGPVIKGYLSEVDLDRVRRDFRGRYKLGYPIAKVIERWFEPSQDSNADIFQRLRTDLLDVPRECGMPRGRYVDLRAFDTIGPYLDWRALMGWSDRS